MTRKEKYYQLAQTTKKIPFHEERQQDYLDDNPNLEAYLKEYDADPRIIKYNHEARFKELKESLDRQFGNLTNAFKELHKDKATSWPKDLAKHVEAGMTSHKFYYGGGKDGMEIVGYHPETYKYVEKENRRIAGITKAINNYIHKRKLN